LRHFKGTYSKKQIGLNFLATLYGVSMTAWKVDYK